jgi:hypothetical protein
VTRGGVLGECGQAEQARRHSRILSHTSILTFTHYFICCICMACIYTYPPPPFHTVFGCCVASLRVWLSEAEWLPKTSLKAVSVGSGKCKEWRTNHNHNHHNHNHNHNHNIKRRTFLLLSLLLIIIQSGKIIRQFKILTGIVSPRTVRHEHACT